MRLKAKRQPKKTKRSKKSKLSTALRVWGWSSAEIYIVVARVKVLLILKLPARVFYIVVGARTRVFLFKHKD